MNSTTENKMNSTELYNKYLEAQKLAYELLQQYEKLEAKEENKYRKVVACYDVTSTFQVPKDIDLEGEEVKDWYVKYDVLHIFFTDPNREKLEIQARMSATEDDLKRPDFAYIANDDEDDREEDEE